mmetsp:Transcript_31508/g.54615  ORF Transcript_31508/g.54615 Transcript_31508/m.54615 type:complete len:195 (+) Transcript_31508:1941-2525(+)
MFWIFAYALTTEKSILANIKSTSSILSAYSNSTDILAEYKVQPLQELKYLVRLKVNPCVHVDDDYCCNGRNEGMCQDNPIVEATSALLVAWSFNNYVTQCTHEFADEKECGTFVEVHRPGSPLVLSDKQITAYYSIGFSTILVDTSQLCAGYYELWWVVRTRTGRILQYARQFFIVWPSCSEAQVAEAGGSVVS